MAQRSSMPPKFHCCSSGFCLRSFGSGISRQRARISHDSMCCVRGTTDFNWRLQIEPACACEPRGGRRKRPVKRHHGQEIVMNTFAKSALVLGTVGALALGSMTASEARSGRWAAGAAGFAVGAAVGAAAANSAYGGYYGSDYAYGPGYYSAGYYEPAYDSYAYAPGYSSYSYDRGYDAYAYAPGYAPRRAYRSGRHVETRSVPHHYDPGAGYNSNTLAP